MNKQQALERLTSLENEVKELRKIIESPQQISPEERFKELIEGWEYKVDLCEYPSCIFIFKGGLCLFEYNFKNGDVWASYRRIWSIFYSEFGYKFNEIEMFIKRQVEKHFNLGGVTPFSSSLSTSLGVEKHFNLGGVTPFLKHDPAFHQVEMHFNC